MGAIKEFQKRERENWESYFESSPAQARVVHYAKALCLGAKLKVLSAKYATIAHALNVSESSVIRSLNKACSLGILKKSLKDLRKDERFIG